MQERLHEIDILRPLTGIDYISVPLWQGAEMQGMDIAPEVLNRLGLLAVLESQFSATYYPLPRLDHVDEMTKYAQLSTYLLKLKAQVLKSFQHSHLPLTIGGDHSIGLGSAAATSEMFKNAGLIWFDAHGDMNTEASSITGHIHGMQVAALMGLCSSEINRVPSTYFKPENIFWIGSRSLDEGEIKLINTKHLHIYSAEHIHQNGMRAVMSEVLEQIHKQGIEHIHLSMDVDAIDPKLFPATSVPEPNGLTFGDFDIFVQSISGIGNQIEAIDWVEYNPTLDNNDYECGKWCVDSICRVLKTIKEQA